MLIYNQLAGQSKVQQFTTKKQMSLQTIISETIDNTDLDQATFSEIINVFNVTVDNPFTPNIMEAFREKFKAKLLDIIQSQGRNYEDYLTLPKFQTLKHTTRQKLYFLFNQIWNQYSQKLQKTQTQVYDRRNETLERMIPEFRGIQEIQAFHLELFKSFKYSKLCKQNQGDNKSTPYHPSSSQIQQASFPRPQNPMYMIDPHVKYMNLPSNNGSMMYSKVQEEPKYMNPVWPERNYIEHSGGFPIPRNTEFQNMPLPSQQVPGIGNAQKYNFFENRPKQQQQENDSLGSESLDNYAENKSYLTGSEDQFFSKVQEYMFSECACEGEHKDNQKYMICKQCQFYFHFECLNLDSSPNDEICPCCKLKQGSNIFVLIHPEPYGKRWCTNMKSQKLSILFTEKQIQRMKMNKKNVKPGSNAEYQLRFLKITKKSKSTNGIKINSQNTRKFNSIPLPTNYIEKVQPFNVFQISLKSNDYNDEPQECTYFFAIFMIEKFSENTLTEELFSNLNDQNSVGEEVLQRYLGEQQSITIKMRDPTSQQKILNPVRGDKCDHAGVFDYLSILQYYKEYGQKLKNQHCSVCSVQIGKMMVDKFVLEKIKKFYQENPDKELESLKYLGNGQVEYIIDQEEYSDIEYSNPEDSEPLSC